MHIHSLAKALAACIHKVHACLKSDFPCTISTKVSCADPITELPGKQKNIRHIDLLSRTRVEVLFCLFQYPTTTRKMGKYHMKHLLFTGLDKHNFSA